MQACTTAGTDLLIRSSDGGTTGLATPPVMYNVDLPYIGQSYCSHKVCHGNIYNFFFFIFLTYTFGLCCVFFWWWLRINIYHKEVKICMFMVSLLMVRFITHMVWFVPYFLVRFLRYFVVFVIYILFWSIGCEWVYTVHTYMLRVVLASHIYMKLFGASHKLLYVGYTNIDKVVSLASFSICIAMLIVRTLEQPSGKLSRIKEISLDTLCDQTSRK